MTLETNPTAEQAMAEIRGNKFTDKEVEILRFLSERNSKGQRDVTHATLRQRFHIKGELLRPFLSRIEELELIEHSKDRHDQFTVRPPIASFINDLENPPPRNWPKWAMQLVAENPILSTLLLAGTLAGWLGYVTGGAEAIVKFIFRPS